MPACFTVFLISFIQESLLSFYLMDFSGELKTLESVTWQGISFQINRIFCAPWDVKYKFTTSFWLRLWFITFFCHFYFIFLNFSSSTLYLTDTCYLGMIDCFWGYEYLVEKLWVCDWSILIKLYESCGIWTWNGIEYRRKSWRGRQMHLLEVWNFIKFHGN